MTRLDHNALLTTLLLSLSASSSSAQPPGTLLWSYDSGNVIAGSPAIATDGTVHFANGALFAVTNMGSNRWTFPIPNGGYAGYSSPAVAVDGTVYVSAGQLYAVDADGRQKWTFAADCGNGSPAIGFSNAVYIHGYGLLYSLTTSGSMVWSNRIGGSYVYGSPSLAPNSTLYAPAPEGQRLYGIAGDGSTKWQAGTYFRTADTAAIAADGTVYTTGGGLYAFSGDGTSLTRAALSTMSSEKAISYQFCVRVATFVLVYGHPFHRGHSVLDADAVLRAVSQMF